jgi:hypothetical protein
MRWPVKAYCYFQLLSFVPFNIFLNLISKPNEKINQNDSINQNDKINQNDNINQNENINQNDSINQNLHYKITAKMLTLPNER